MKLMKRKKKDGAVPVPQIEYFRKPKTLATEDDDALQQYGLHVAQQIVANKKAQMDGAFGTRKDGENRAKPKTDYELYIDSINTNPEIKKLTQRVKDEMWAEHKVRIAVQAGLDLRA